MAGVKDGIVRRGTTWSYVIRVQDPETGRSRPRWVGGFATEREAKTARDEARVAASRSEYVNRTTVTVAQYLDSWLTTHEVEVKPQTFASYRDLIDRYVKPRLGEVRLQAVQPAMLTRLYGDLLKAGGVGGRPLAPTTIDKVHAILRKAFHDAVNIDRLLSSSPVDRAKRPRRDRTSTTGMWTPADLYAFLETARSHRLFPFFHLAAYTGARRGELLNLIWSDIDFGNALLEIRGTVAVISGTRVEGTTKGGHSRTVSLDDATVAILRTHQREQREERFASGPDWTAGDLVFTRGTGQPLYPDTPSQLLPKLIERHNQTARRQLARIRLHDLRHIHATVLLEAGVPVHVVAGRLGHADPSITLRVYAHVLRASETKAADIFASAIGG